MRVEWAEWRSESELKDRMRQVTLEGTGERIYAPAPPVPAVEIKIAPFPLDRIQPAQRYVLRQDLDRVFQLRHALRDGFNIDILFLDQGFVEMKLEGEDSPIHILPPVVEEHWHGVNQTRLVCDGMHRLYLAYLEWVMAPYVLLVGEVRTPYYAYPIPGPNPWEKVEIRQELPDGYLKRWPRCPDHKKLFRNFDSPGAFNTRHTSRGVTGTERKVIFCPKCGSEDVRAGTYSKNMWCGACGLSPIPPEWVG